MYYFIVFTVALVRCSIKHISCTFLHVFIWKDENTVFPEIDKTCIKIYANKNDIEMMKRRSWLCFSNGRKCVVICDISPEDFMNKYVLQNEYLMQVTTKPCGMLHFQSSIPQGNGPFIKILLKN